MAAPFTDPTREGTFADSLEAHGDRVAVVDGTGTLTYAALADRVRSVGEDLGSRPRLVLLEAANGVESLVAYLAALRGRHPVILTAADDDAFRTLLATYDPDVTIAAQDGWAVRHRRQVPKHDLHPELALLLSTSGSTGSPKLVRLSRRNLQTNAEAIASYLHITAADRAITSLPMRYCYGLSVINSHLVRGAGLVLTDLSVVDACFWDLFRQTGTTSFAGVPYTFELLDRVGFDAFALPSLRYVTQAGGRLPAESVRRWSQVGEQRGWSLFVMYGQTEATARMAYLPPALASSSPQAIGRPIPGGSFTLEPFDGAAAGAGELVYRGPNVMLGYAETAADLALGATMDALHTGDVARLAGEDLYELVGRRSRFIKPFGVRVDLDEVERLLTDTGVPSLATGDDDVLVVAVESASDIAVVEEVVRSRLGLPRSHLRILALATLPRFGNGKPNYSAVRLVASEGGAGCEPGPEPTTGGASDGRGTLVRAAFEEIIGRQADDDDTFVSLGGDSLSYVEMSIRLEEILGTLPDGWHVTPVRQLSDERGRRSRVPRLETSVVVRALGIVLVVGTHIKLWHVLGGAHALLGVAGFNFGRFQLQGTSMLRSLARIAIPSVCWMALVTVTTDDLTWQHVLLVNGQLGADDAHGGYWFVEALVQILVPLALLFTIPGVRRFEAARPLLTCCIFLAAALAVRFDIIPVASSEDWDVQPHEISWLFAIGWMTAKATTTTARLGASAVTVIATPGFFGEPHRELLVTAAMLLLIWVPAVPTPAALRRLVGAVAGASLFIYLTHWQVFPWLVRGGGPVVALVGSVLVGIVASAVAQRPMAALEAILRRIRSTGPTELSPKAAAPSWRVPDPVAGGPVAPTRARERSSAP